MTSKKDDNQMSFISKAVIMNAEIRSQGVLDICGKIEGKIVADNVFIREGAFVSGEIFASYLSIAGIFEGTCKVKELSLDKNGCVKGNVFYNGISVENGGMIDGSINNKIDEAGLKEIDSIFSDK